MNRRIVVGAGFVLAVTSACGDEPSSPPALSADAGDVAEGNSGSGGEDVMTRDAGSLSPGAGSTPAEPEPCLPVPVGSGQDPLIDDFEDGDQSIASVDQRSGFAGSWVSPGGSVQLEAVAGGAPGSTRAMRFSGSTPQMYGAGFSLSLNDGPERRCAFDASNYRGIAFWARGEGGLTELGILFSVAGDHRCYQSSDPYTCPDWYAGTVLIDSTWRRYEVPWEQVAYFGAAANAVSDAPSTIRALYEIQFKPDANPAGFAFAIDDVEFLVGGCGQGICNPASPCPSDCCGNGVCETSEYGLRVPSQTGTRGAGLTYCAEDCASVPIECPTQDLGTQVPQIVQGNTARLTDDATASCAGSSLPPLPASPDAEYVFTAPATGRYSFEATSQSFEPVLYVLDGACTGPELRCGTLSADLQFSPSVVSMPLNEGQVVTLVVDGRFGNGGPFTLEVERLADDCPGEDLGSSVPQTLAGTTAGATNSIAPGCGDTSSPDASYLWTAPRDGLFAFDLAGSDFDTVLELRDGGCDGPSLACNDNVPISGVQSRVVAPLMAGQTVAAIIDGNGAAGAYELAITEFGCPDVDLGSAVPATAAGSVQAGETGFLSSGCSFGVSLDEVTFGWTAPTAGTYRFSADAAFETLISLLDGQSCDGPEIACNVGPNPNTAAGSLVASLGTGQAVVAVAEGLTTGSGEISLSVESVVCPEGDLGDEMPVTTTGTLSAGHDFVFGSCGGRLGSDTAFSWTAPGAGTYVFDTVGSDFDSILYLLSGASCAGTRLVCNDDADAGLTSRVTASLAAGQTVTVVVDSFSQFESGQTYVLSITAQ